MRAARLLPIAMLVLLPGRAIAVCPTNTLDASGNVVVTADAAHSTLGVYRCEYGDVVSLGHGSVGYDLAHGTLTASGTTEPECCGYGSGSTHDVFTLFGPAGSALISLTAHLHVTASVTGSGTAGASLREGASNGASYADPPGPDDATISITIARHVGETFDLFLDYNATACGDGDASLNGTLSFSDLPPGYAVASCQGFLSDPSVPAATTSWGRLRAIYR
jgi:hypothetical protein